MSDKNHKKHIKCAEQGVQRAGVEKHRFNEICIIYSIKSPVRFSEGVQRTTHSQNVQLNTMIMCSSALLCTAYGFRSFVSTEDTINAGLIISLLFWNGSSKGINNACSQFSYITRSEDTAIIIRVKRLSKVSL